MSDVKKNLEEIKKGAKGILEAGKEAAYKLGSKIEQTVSGEGGLIDDAKDFGKKIVDEVKESVDGVKKSHESIKEKGGYAKAMRDYGKKLSRETHELYEDFRTTFYDEDGKFSSDKAKAVLKNKTEATKKFGQKAINDLSDMIREGAEAVQKDYRQHIPNKEERAGVGDKYHGVVTRKHLEECLGFEKKIKKKLPGGLKVRSKVIEDVRAYAITNKRDLKDLYNNDDSIKSAVKKYIR